MCQGCSPIGILNLLLVTLRNISATYMQSNMLHVHAYMLQHICCIIYATYMHLKSFVSEINSYLIANANHEPSWKGLSLHHKEYHI